MSTFNIVNHSVIDIFKDKNYLIPDYQRPYAWGEEECQTLWNDIISFALPEDDYEKFDPKTDQYFLGPIVVFKNSNGQLEVIDGQQRLTTLTLLIRAIYSEYLHIGENQKLNNTKNFLSTCLWKADELGVFDMKSSKIESKVATDNDIEEFINIIQGPNIIDEENKEIERELKKDFQSRYTINYQFFRNQIKEYFESKKPIFSYLASRILNNCILLSIETDTQDSALRVFSTLNDRGKPLSDADIFKSQFYKKFKDKDEFIKNWKKLEETTNDCFESLKEKAMDEIFTRYMYYERARSKIKDTTTEALRKFYEKDNYKLFREDKFNVFENLQSLAYFWNQVKKQNNNYFSERILKQLFILNYAPNRMWTYITSVYYMHNKDKDNKLDESNFFNFLRKLTLFIWVSTITNSNLSTLRTPIYNEMINIIDNKDISFSLKYTEKQIRNMFDNFIFSNYKAITKSMLIWYAFNNPEQSIPNLKDKFDIEHIYAKKRNEKAPLSKIELLESLGNKSILEKEINIRASDYRFEDKKDLYLNSSNSKASKGTQIEELKSLTVLKDFTETEIIERYNKIKDDFINELKANNLIKK